MKQAIKGVVAAAGLALALAAGPVSAQQIGSCSPDFDGNYIFTWAGTGWDVWVCEGGVPQPIGFCPGEHICIPG